MRQNPSRKRRLDPVDVWQNFFARDELEEQVKQARPILKSLAEAFAKADIDPDKEPIVEDVHVKRAADVLYSLARKPKVYARTGSPELFISFASQQAADARPLIRHLEAASYRCFFSDESVPYSKKWAEEIWHAVRVCVCFLPVVTPDWIASRWCAYEFGAAVALNKPIVPIIIGSVETAPVIEYEGFKLKNAAQLRDLPDKQETLWHHIRRQLRRLSYRKKAEGM